MDKYDTYIECDNYEKCGEFLSNPRITMCNNCKQKVADNSATEVKELKPVNIGQSKLKNKIDPATKQQTDGWYAFDNSSCNRCELPLGPWGIKDTDVEFFGCGICCYGALITNEDNAVNHASDKMNALFKD